MKFVKVPLDRLGALIGPDGRTKAAIEARLKVTLRVDSDAGDVLVEPRGDADPLAELKGENVVRAIGRGFNPQHALKLSSDDVYFVLLDMHDYVPHTKEHVRRVTARLVGTGGKTRRILEDLTGAKLSIYGHTVGVIGTFEEAEVAREALDMLLTGSEHSTVYRFLEHKRREQKMAKWGV